MLRIGMTNPPYILEHLKEIADVLRHPCVYSFLHVPVQSGSDAVLSVSLRMCKCFPSNSYWFFFDVPYNHSFFVLHSFLLCLPKNFCLWPFQFDNLLFYRQ